MSDQSMDTHMHFRLSEKDKKVIEAAAKIKGLKPNTYARQRLVEVAEKDLSEMNSLNTVILNENEWDKFMYLMDAPFEENKHLRKAIDDFNSIMGE